MVGVKGFEPSASWSQTKRSTKLSYTPKYFDLANIKATVASIGFEPIITNLRNKHRF